MDQSFDYIRRIVPATETMFLVPAGGGTPSNAVVIDNGTVVTLDDGTIVTD